MPKLTTLRLPEDKARAVELLLENAWGSSPAKSPNIDAGHGRKVNARLVKEVITDLSTRG